MSIILNRDNANQPKTNIEHTITRFNKPFDWGVISDGAAELSLNILDLFCDEFTRERLYNKFMTDIISDIPYGGTVIAEEEIEAWIAENSQLEDKRNKSSFIVAVYRDETNTNQLHRIEAFTELEAIIRACECYEEDESYVQSLLQKLKDFDDIVNYYEDRGIYFSEPEKVL